MLACCSSGHFSFDVPLFVNSAYPKMDPSSPGHHITAVSQGSLPSCMWKPARLWGMPKSHTKPQRSREELGLTWVVFHSVCSYGTEIQTSDLLSEGVHVHLPFGEAAWQLLLQLQLHRVRILMLPIPHMDWKPPENVAIFLLKQILEQVASGLSVYIFVCHLTACQAALRTNLS